MDPQPQCIKEEDEYGGEVNVPKAQENAQQQIELKSLNHESLFYTYIQRYYTTYESSEQYVHMHTNGLFLVRVKVSALPAPPLSINNCLEPVEVRGKKKKGGVRVKANTIVAEIKCSDGSQFAVKACVQGTVIENNERLTIENIGADDGYFVIINPGRRFIPENVGMKRIFYNGNSSATREY